jgi:type I restriction enzyme M protein
MSFQNAGGSEGTHPIQRGKTIDECTRLFDAERFDNPEKASAYIYKAFAGDYDFPIHDSLKDNVFRVRLAAMIAFDRANFEKTISTVVKKIESKWEQILFENTLQKIKGPVTKIEKYNGLV